MVPRLPKPYYDADGITLYHADCRDILPLLPKVDAVITDPTYGVTNLSWDIWCDGWPELVKPLTTSLWCFGSFRMFLDRQADFAGWRYAQDIVWEKHNGTNSSNDRFRRVHELAVQFYRSDTPWSDIYKSPVYTNDATKKTVRRKARPPQWGEIGSAIYTSEDGGPRLMGSVIYCRSCHGFAVNETQKPVGIVAPLIEFSIPAGGGCLDPFAGSGTTLIAARAQGKRAIGIELRENQCAEAVLRLSERELPLHSVC